MIEKCPYCDGYGRRDILINSAGYHFHGDEPIVDQEPCEECGGVGYIENEEGVKNEK